MDDVLTLLSAEDWKTDENGNQYSSLPAREVFCRIESVGRADFYAASQLGLKPTVKAVVCRFDYEGEKLAEYNGVRYSVHRTYAESDGDRVELYLTERSGDNDEGEA